MIRDPKLRVAVLAAYRAWARQQEQLSLFDDAELLA